MVRTRNLGILFALAFVAAPAISEASFAKKLGSRYGGTLSSNASTGTQQLTADPVSVLRGSTSTEYDPHVVSLSSIAGLPGFNITEAYVGVSFDNGATEDLVSLSQYTSGLDFQYQETGYLQVFYQSSSEGEGFASLMAPAPGYTVVDTDGELAGDNTHTMTFDYLAADPTTVAHYRLYADDGVRGTSPDSLVSIEDPSFVIRDIGEANVAGALIPLPAAFGPALIGFAGIGITKRLRKRLFA